MATCFNVANVSIDEGGKVVTGPAIGRSWITPLATKLSRSKVLDMINNWLDEEADKDPLFEGFVVQCCDAGASKVWRMKFKTGLYNQYHLAFSKGRFKLASKVVLMLYTHNDHHGHNASSASTSTSTSESTLPVV